MLLCAYAFVCICFCVIVLTRLWRATVTFHTNHTQILCYIGVPGCYSRARETTVLNLTDSLVDETKQNLSILQTGHPFTWLSLCQCIQRGWQICGWMAQHNGGIVHPPLAQKLGISSGGSISNQPATCSGCLGRQLRSYVTLTPPIYPSVSPVSCHVCMHPAIVNL